MSHSWDCPSRWESERQARRDAERDFDGDPYGPSSMQIHRRAEQFTDCEESQRDYEREYRREMAHLEEREEERRREERWAQEREERRLEEARAYERAMEEEYFRSLDGGLE